MKIQAVELACVTLCSPLTNCATICDTKPLPLLRADPIDICMPMWYYVAMNRTALFLKLLAKPDFEREGIRHQQGRLRNRGLESDCSPRTRRRQFGIMPTPEQQRLYTKAHHEAGHAVAALVLGDRRSPVWKHVPNTTWKFSVRVIEV
jgi:hypothetical protein